MSQLFNWFGWFFLPGLATGFVQTFYYRITIRAGDPHPPANSPRWVRDRRRIFVLVILLYLFYTVYEAVWTLRRQGDFYGMLGVPTDVDDRGIKAAYNKIARVRHPDKAPAQLRAEAQDFFVQITRAKDTLLNPTKRFAYDRLGEVALDCKTCASRGEYVWVGLSHMLGWYGITGVFMLFLGMLGYAPWGTYWRWTMLVGIALIEVLCITRPTFLPFLLKINYVIPLLPFQLVALLRAFLVTVSIAFNQLGPVLNKATSSSLDEQLSRVDNLVKATDAESNALLGVDMAPFIGDEATLKSVKLRLKDWLVEQTIRSDPEVRDAVGRVLQRKRDAPHGARGTR